MKSIIRKLLHRTRHTFSTIDYWESRYQSGGNSGSGSYNRLAEFKAAFMNEFLAKNNIAGVIEFGCGDGHQLSMIRYPKYIGLDVARTSIQLCGDKFKTDPTKSFFVYDPFSFIDNEGVFRFDVSLSLDVIFHLVEDEIYELYMRHLFQSATRFVIIYSSDYEQPRVNHERRRKFSSWAEKNAPAWKLLERKENPFRNEPDPELQSLSDFCIYQKI